MEQLHGIGFFCVNTLLNSDVSLQDGYFTKFGILHGVFGYKSEDATEDGKNNIGRVWGKTLGRH